MIRPGQIWRDQERKPISLRSGSVIQHDRTWWWIGVDDFDGDGPQGIRAHSSIDLMHWTDRGIVLPADEIPGGVAGGPKVVCCPRTGGLILWFHLPLSMTAGVAFASQPGNPFSFLHAIRSKDGITPEMTIFAEDDGCIWLLFGIPGKDVIFARRINPTGLQLEGEPILIYKGGFHRTPALMKWDGCYWLLATDGEHGRPGEPCLSVAPTLRGSWEPVGNPCIGSKAELATCFHSRPSWIIRMPGYPDRFVLVADGISRGGQAASPVWLPLDFRHGVPELRWLKAWCPSRWSEGEGREMS